MVERCLVFSCMLHCCMAVGRLQVAFIEGRLGVLHRDNAVAVQRVVFRARTGVTLGASNSPDGEEARVLFLTWGPLLAYAPEEDERQAVVAMRDLPFLSGPTTTTQPAGGGGGLRHWNGRRRWFCKRGSGGF